MRGREKYDQVLFFCCTLICSGCSNPADGVDGVYMSDDILPASVEGNGPAGFGACTLAANSGSLACDLPTQKEINCTNKEYADVGVINYSGVGSVVDALSISPSGKQLVISFSDFQPQNIPSLALVDLNTGDYSWLNREEGSASSFEFVSDDEIVFFRFSESLGTWHRCSSISECQNSFSRESRLVGSLTLLNLVTLNEASLTRELVNGGSFVDDFNVTEDVRWFGPGRIYRKGPAALINHADVTSPPV